MPLANERFPASSFGAAAVRGGGAGKHQKKQTEEEWISEMHKLPGVFVGVRVSNPLNSRRSWRPVWAASKRARMLARWSTETLMKRTGIYTLPVRVTMVRYGPRSLDVGCGLNASLKPIRDGMADAFSVDDADERYEWVYRQERSKWYGVRIELEVT